MLGRILAGVGILAFGAYHGMTSDTDLATDFVPIDARVIEIDRECGIDTYAPAPDGGKGELVGQSRGSCIGVNGWTAIRAMPHDRRQPVEGTATMRFAYTSPVDGSSRTGSLNFTGQDREFYDWDFGETVTLLAHKKKHDRFRRP